MFALNLYFEENQLLPVLLIFNSNELLYKSLTVWTLIHISKSHELQNCYGDIMPFFLAHFAKYTKNVIIQPPPPPPPRLGDFWVEELILLDRGEPLTAEKAN